MDNGGPAFPFVGDNWVQHGMSLRDWFAGQALAGLAMRIDEQEQTRIKTKAGRADWEATVAYTLADAMLKARADD